MRSLVAALSASLLALLPLGPAPVCAQEVAASANPTLAYEMVIFEEPGYVQQPVAMIADEAAAVVGGERLVDSGWQQAQPAPIPAGLARYGPFRVVDAQHVALVDVTDSHSPAQFAALLHDWPTIAEIEMIECPGTEDDFANLRLGRMIRERGIATHVPDGGSVRSGAVELFLAGTRRYADAGAEFAVHSWIDDSGHEAGDFAADSPENRRYLDYYRQMGMDPQEARAFYAMTNSVPFESALWFGAAEMGRWVRLDREGA
ncbi:alpha/beta hydrolase [Novosphingobium sp. BL-8A]|uniref:alpha/beta hydrolase n=1 Tax=Novosphingobium sp. BL-8A TaxID=3127639 RepID=UPI003756ABFD